MAPLQRTKPATVPPLGNAPTVPITPVAGAPSGPQSARITAPVVDAVTEPTGEPAPETKSRHELPKPTRPPPRIGG
jgi:hypothetical protein